MKKILSLCMMALASSSVALAQNTIVTGTLKDSVLNETEPYATIRVYKKGNYKTPVAMSVTGANGEIKQAINGKGNYIISFESVGKKNIRREITLNGESTLNIGDVYTAEDSKLLKGVEVVAQKPIVKMETDKMTYNVQEDVDSKSSTILDMIRKVPMVSVDGQDNITVNGGSGFKIYVDGKPNPMLNSNASDILKAMPATLVKNIEVITNPGAKYDAEGTTAILNITMNREGAEGASAADMNGYNGSLSATASTRGWRGSASLSGQQGKFSYNAMGMYSDRNMDGMDTEMTQTEKDGSTMITKQTGDTKNSFAMGNLGLGIDFDAMTSMHATFSLMKMNAKNEGNAITNNFGGRFSNGYNYTNSNLTKMNRTSINASADISRYLNKEHTSSIALTYQFSTSPNQTENKTIYDKDYSELTQYSFTDRYTDNNPKSTEHTLQLDYVTPVGKSNSLSLGAKYVNHANKADSKFYDILNGKDIYNQSLSSLYEDNQSILAGYAEFNGSFGKFSTREGLRYEHTWESISYQLGNKTDFKKNYGSLVPSLSLTYNIAPTMNLGASYAMHILRPGITYLNPYIDRSNPTQLSYGNENLDVEKSHYIKLVFNSYSQKFMFNFTVGQNFCNNQIGEYSFMDENNLLNRTYTNNIKNRWTNFSSYMRWTPSKTTVLSLSADVDYGDIRSEALDLKNHGWQFNGYLGLEQTLPAKISWSTGVFGQSKTYELMGYNSGMSIFTTSLTKKFCDDKLSVSLRYMVPFTGKLNFEQYSHSSAYTQSTKINVPVQDINLTVTWNFGNTKKRFQQHQSRVQSEYGEKASSSETIGNTGSTGTGMGM